MANITTFTVSGFFNQVDQVTEITSVTSSSGTGLATNNKAVAYEGDTITYTWNGSTGGVGLQNVSSTLWSNSGLTLNSANNVVLTAKTGVSGTNDPFVSANFDIFTQYLEHGGVSITAPTISGTTFLYYNNQTRALYERVDAAVTYAASSFFVRTQINLSNNGSGGTLEYGRNTSSNSASGASWQTSGTSYNWPGSYPDQQDSPNAANVFNHLNNSTRYFFASQDRATAGTFDSTGAVTYSHVNPSSVTVNNVSNVALSTTSLNVTINGCTTDSGGTMSDKSPNPISHAEVYSISKTDHGSTDIAIATVSGDRIDKVNSNGSTSISFNIPSADMPAQTAGASETYYVYSLRRFEWSGDYLYDKTDTFTITRTNTTNDPDIDVTETSTREITPGATSYTMTFSNGTSGDQYQLRHYDGGAQTGTIVDLLNGPSTADASGNFSIDLQSSDLPASGTADTKWYSLYAKRTIANGGSNSYFYCNGTTLVNTLNLTRRPLNPTITISDDDAASANVGIIATIADSNTFTADRLVLVQYTGASAGSPDSQTTALRTDYTGAGTYSGDFTQPRNTGSDNYFYRAYLQKLGTGTTPVNELTGSSFSDYDPSNGGDYQAGYIAPDLNINAPTRTPSGNLSAAYIGDVDINITGATINDTVRVVRTSPSTLDCADTGILTSTSGTATLEYGVSGHLPPANTTYTYKLRVKRAASKGGTDVYADTNPLRTFSITRDAPVATYSISAPTSINEGASGTVNVTTTNVANSTVLYWDVDLSADYATSQGTVTITSNAGSFTLSPSSDSATEGAETDTVRLYTDSNRTIEVANDSFTINDTSTGGGGSGGGSDGNSTYGLNVYGPDGSTIVFSSNLRSTNALVLASPTIAGGNSVSYTGIADATNASKIAVVINDTADASLFEQDSYTITRTTASGGTIQITNDLSTSRTPSISIYRVA